jgi:ABC-2 type transport system permease protein
MTSLSYALTDSATMLRRNLRHALRYPSMTISVIVSPVFMLLLFEYVLGGAMSTGTTGHPDRSAYLAYIAPGVLLMTIASGMMVIAISVCTDMTTGVIARFRTMAISRASVLTGHVLGSVIQSFLAAALAFAVSVALGYRPSASAMGWLAAAGLVLLVAFALTWLGVAFGLLSKTPEAASNIVLPVSLVLPFLSSAFVPLASLPSGVRWFAQNQPFTPIIDTFRGLLTNTPIGHRGLVAVAWCAAIALGGYVWSKSLYNRKTVN